MVNGITNPTILVPLCGKSVDLIWLVSQPGVRVIGIEGVIDAIEQFQLESKIELKKFDVDYVSSDGKLQILLRNFLDTKSLAMDSVNCVWDRAALVAVDPSDRIKYAESINHVLDTEGRFNYLLNVVEYDSTTVTGPPYSISRIDIDLLYSSTFSIEEVARKRVMASGTNHIPQKFRQANIDIDEVLYILTNK